MSSFPRLTTHGRKVSLGLVAWLLVASAFLLSSTSSVAGAPSTSVEEVPGEQVPQAEDTFVVLRTSGVDGQLFDLADDLSGRKQAGHLCVDLTEFAQAVEFPIDVDLKAKTAKGWFFDEKRSFALDLTTATLTIAGHSRPFKASDIDASDDGLCVDLHALESWFGVKLTFDQSAALVELKAFEPLPFMQRQNRLNDRSLLGPLGGKGSQEVAAVKPLAYTWFTPPTVDVTVDGSSSFGSTNRQSVNVSMLAVGEVAKFSGEFLLRGQGERPMSLRGRLFRRSAGGGVFGFKDITEVAMGDVAGLADDVVSGGGFGRGFAMSSFPAGTADRFSDTTLSGDLPEGWDAELYRNGTLIAAKSSDGTGRYAFEGIAVLPGDNLLKVILYGPQGQRKIIDRSVHAAPMIVPKGKIYSRFTVFQQGVNLFGDSDLSLPGAKTGLRFEAEARATPVAAVTFDARLSRFELNAKMRNYGAVAASTTLANSNLQLEGIFTDHGGSGAQLSVDRKFGDSFMTLHVEKYTHHFSSERIDSGLSERAALDLNSSLRISPQKSVLVSLRSRFEGRYDRSMAWSVSGQAGISLRRNWITNTVNVSGENLNSSTRKSPVTMDGGLQWSNMGETSSTRWQIDYSVAPKISIDHITVSRDPTPDLQNPHWQVGANLSYSPHTHMASLGLSASHNINKATLSVHAEFDSDRNVSVGVALAFSIGRDEARQKWEIEPRSEAQRGRVVARVYEDANNNGIFDNGDSYLPDAKVSVSGSDERYVTDSGGLAMIYGLEPETQLQIKVDPDSITSGLIASTSGAAVTISRGGGVAHIDVPVNLVGSISGHVIVTDTMPNMAGHGLVVHLIDKDGHDVAQARVNRDGDYNFDDVVYGIYYVTLQTEGERDYIPAAVGPQAFVLARDNPEIAMNVRMPAPDGAMAASSPAKPKQRV